MTAGTAHEPPAARTDAARAAYDYVLVVGPGRSGSTFLYRQLNAHPAFAAPEIKEGYYYRSARRLERARRRLRGAVLLDVANVAWADPRLAAVARLRRRGHRILVVVLLRQHRERAVSVIGYRLCRVPFAGARAAERAALREILTAPALERIFALGADVLAVRFDTLVGEPRAVLDAVAGLCGTARFESVGTAPVNVSMRARHAVLVAAGKLAAVVLRAAGARRLLQALKDEPRIVGLFFRPARPGERVVLGAAAGARLDRQFDACLAAVEAACEPLGDGLWFASGGALDSAQRASRGDGAGPLGGGGT